VCTAAALWWWSITYLLLHHPHLPAIFCHEESWSSSYSLILPLVLLLLDYAPAFDLSL
jgi:hypothetical protein